MAEGYGGRGKGAVRDLAGGTRSWYRSMSHLKAVCQNDVWVHGSHIQVVDKGTLDSVGNIFQGGELRLNLITHLETKGKEVEAGDPGETQRLHIATRRAPEVPDGHEPPTPGLEVTGAEPY